MTAHPFRGYGDREVNSPVLAKIEVRASPDHRHLGDYTFNHLKGADIPPQIVGGADTVVGKSPDAASRGAGRFLKREHFRRPAAIIGKRKNARHPVAQQFALHTCAILSGKMGKQAPMSIAFPAILSDH